MKKKITWFIVLAIFVANVLSGQKVWAQTPPEDFVYQYATPQDFIRWLGDVPNRHKEFVKAYKKEQGYFLAPKVKGAVLDDMCWGIKDVALNYGFHNANISWRMYVYPIKDCKKENYYSEDIGTLVNKKDGGIVFNKKEQEVYTNYFTGDTYTITDYYEKKKVQLGDYSTVNCVENIFCKKDKKTNVEKKEIYLHFFKSGMYILVSSNFNADIDGEKSLTEVMKNCTFQKHYIRPVFELNKSKVSKKTVLLYTTMHNPTKAKFSYIKFYLYDKKKKKYTLCYTKKITGKNKRKKTVSTKLDVKQCLKKGKKQLRKKKEYPLKRKKRYYYKIRAGVGIHCEIFGSFKLK